MLGGYICDSGRRVVLLNWEKELAIRPCNIYYGGKSIQEKTFKRVDMVDRLHSVALHEVIMSQRVDVAKFLLQQKPDLDVGAASYNPTPRKMIAMGMQTPVTQMIHRYAAASSSPNRQTV